MTGLIGFRGGEGAKIENESYGIRGVYTADGNVLRDTTVLSAYSETKGAARGWYVKGISRQHLRWCKKVYTAQRKNAFTVGELNKNGAYVNFLFVMAFFFIIIIIHLQSLLIVSVRSVVLRSAFNTVFYYPIIVSYSV